MKMPFELADKFIKRQMISRFICNTRTKHLVALLNQSYAMNSLNKKSIFIMICYSIISTWNLSFQVIIYFDNFFHKLFIFLIEF